MIYGLIKRRACESVFGGLALTEIIRGIQRMKSMACFIALFTMSSSAWAHAGTSNAFWHVIHHALIYFGIGIVVGVPLLLWMYAVRQPRTPNGSVKI